MPESAAATNGKACAGPCTCTFTDEDPSVYRVEFGKPGRHETRAFCSHVCLDLYMSVLGELLEISEEFRLPAWRGSVLKHVDAVMASARAQQPHGHSHLN